MSVVLWKKYAPSKTQPWNAHRVIHLHRRAAFGPTLDQVQRDVQDGPDAAIGRLLSGRIHSQYGHDEFESLSRRLGADAVSSRRVDRLRAWWIFRMLFTPDPLTERLVLMWHNHFATSIRKVKNLNMMKIQNELLRRYAKSSFSELFTHTVKSPAMLIWLDAQANHKEHPNENLAREIMELFSLGVGNYSETDIKEAARALTGWRVEAGKFAFKDDEHDDGEKTIFGETGQWDGDDLLNLLINHPATASRVAFRICELFMGENVVGKEALAELATGIRTRGLDVRWGIETVIRSDAFFHESNIGNRPLAPIEFVVGAVRGLELFSPPPSTILLDEWCESMGQSLFAPPSVFGWDGGRAWLTTRTLIARANFANAVANGRLHSDQRSFSFEEIAQKYQMDAADLRNKVAMLLAPGYTSNANVNASPSQWVEQLLSSPDAQLG